MTAIPSIAEADAAMEAERSMLTGLLGAAGIADILDALDSTLTSDPAALASALEKREREATSRCAHRIKGGFSSLGATRLCALLAKLEADARTADWNDIEALHGEAMNEFERVVGRINSTWR